MFLKVNSLIFDAMLAETYWRIGVSACRRLQSVLQLRRDLLLTKTVSKSSLASPDADPPIRFR
jgi:hypothetical protein